MRKLTRQHLIIPVAAALLIAGMLAHAAHPRRWDTEAAARKADYVFMESLNAEMRGDAAGSYALTRHAHETNPDDEYIGANYGIYPVHLERDDSAAVKRGLELMRRYFDRNPDDLYSGLNYALITQVAGEQKEALRAYSVLHRLNPERDGITYRYAEMLAQSGESGAIDSALAIYTSMEQTAGANPELTTAKLRVLFLKQDTAAILSEAMGLFEKAPESPETNMFVGDVMATLQLNDSALVYYNRACELDSTNAMAYYSRAGFYHNVGDSAAFDREIFKVLKMEQLDMDTKMGVMRSYVRELYGDTLQTPRILDLFDTMVSLHPHDSELRQFYASYLYLTDRRKEAAEQQERALDLEPDDEEGWNTLVSIEMQNEDYQRALRSVDRAIDYFPASARFRMLRGGITDELDSTAVAIGEFDMAITLADSTDTELLSTLYCWKADLFARMEQNDSALANYRESFVYNPFNYLALNNYAYLLANTGGNLDEARKCIERVIANNEPEATWLDTYAWVLFKQHDYENARIQIDRVLELAGADAGAEELEHAGDIYYFSGEPEKALEYWKSALKLDADNRLLNKKVRNKSYYYE